LNIHLPGCPDMLAAIDAPHRPLVQTLPQPLQLCGSLAGSTQAPLQRIWPVEHVGGGGGGGGGGDESMAVDESIAGDESAVDDESTPGAPTSPPDPPPEPEPVAGTASAESSPESSPVAPASSQDAAASGDTIAPVNPSRDTSAHPCPAATPQSDAVQSIATRQARGCCIKLDRSA
jgi:hypothetical protein